MGVNTITVAGIIGLTSRKSLIDIWVDSYLWTSPQYLVGGAIAGCVDVLSQSWGWPALVIGVPPLLLLHRSYLLYLGRIEQQQNHIREMAGLHLRTIETLALACKNTNMAELAETLERMAGAYIDHPVVDATGLEGGFDFTMGWTGKALLQPAAQPDDEPVPAGFVAFSGRLAALQTADQTGA
jgi:hypothetical protein